MFKKLFIVAIILINGLFSQSLPKKSEFDSSWSNPSKRPDHILLNFSDDPATSVSVTWRTSREINKGFGEIAVAKADPKFVLNPERFLAKTSNLRYSNVVNHYKNSKKSFNTLNHNYHSVTFTGLEPNTTYAYRVGDGKHWSEWIQFTTAHRTNKPFSFLYVGDAQNYIYDLWSRLIRESYKKAPNASFIIHAGDLIDDAHNEEEWHEWFAAGGWIHRSLPSLAVPGNHEYRPLYQKDITSRKRTLSIQWQHQFTLPNNGLYGLLETHYFLDYQGVRFIGLNSNVKVKEQTEWLETVLKNNPHKWVVVFLHHPIYSASTERDNPERRNLLKPLFDKYGVDIVLQGHDHAYARGSASLYEKNILSGTNVQDATGTVYVVSVSGSKQYEAKPNWDQYDAVRDKAGEDKQLFQVISIDGNTLSYKSYTAVGDLFDSFDLIKNENGINSLKNN
tara:strand:- start:408 stop:1754 length:1347 start_codon:yes stop_codon:yes gene_type:complete